MNGDCRLGVCRGWGAGGDAPNVWEIVRIIRHNEERAPDDPLDQGGQFDCYPAPGKTAEDGINRQIKGINRVKIG